MSGRASVSVLPWVRSASRARLTLNLSPEEPEGEAAGSGRGGALQQRADGEIDEVAPERKAGLSAGRNEESPEPLVRGVAGESTADDDVVVLVGRHDTGAPLHADGEEVVALEDLHPRLDLHLRRRDVERFADELLHALELGRVEAQEDRVRRAVHGDADAERDECGPGGRRLLRLRRGPEERGEGGLRDGPPDGGAPQDDGVQLVAPARLHLGEALEAEQTLQRVGDVAGIGIREADRLLDQRPARDRLGDGGFVGALALLRLLLLQLGLCPLRPDLDVGLDLGLLDARPRLALLRQLLDGDDPDHALALDVLQPARVQDGLEREPPGDVAQRDRHPALDVVADHDVPVAFGGEDAQQVDDLGVLELERDQLLSGRGGRRHGRLPVGRPDPRQQTESQRGNGNRPTPRSHQSSGSRRTMRRAVEPRCAGTLKTTLSAPISTTRASASVSPTFKM